MNEPLSPEFWLRDATLVDLLSLSSYKHAWKGNIDIIPRYIPPYPPANYQPTVAVGIKRRYLRTEEDSKNFDEWTWLRHSKGPHQSFFWDVYPDNMMTVGLAILAIIQAPYPVSGDRIFTPTRR